MFPFFRRQRPRTWQGQLRSVTTIEAGDRVGQDADDVRSVERHSNGAILVHLERQVTLVYLPTEEVLVFKELKR
jgi:hypothetical protein